MVRAINQGLNSPEVNKYDKPVPKKETESLAKKIGKIFSTISGGPDRSRPNTKRDPNIVEMQQVFGANFGERLDRFYAVEAERLGISLNTQK